VEGKGGQCAMVEVGKEPAEMREKVSERLGIRQASFGEERHFERNFSTVFHYDCVCIPFVLR
jgi:hypothetical protein